MTRVLLNGQEHRLTGPADLASVVASLAPARAPAPSAGGCGTAPPTGIAAAVNDRVVPRSRWASTLLDDDDRIEIVTAVQGG
ncbi:sulfur carrier protein ThiS [Sanguibacter antarcticus]|uniref:Sulfur carrier protein n=1 Tax=Sanguibacter antarcticus TaxID=372484 RepID=A0A2A9E4Q4_9MICO|nr:sulfur carrier protein ThiS [Sanguibacter antarcticus]PFG33938.1 sulfur carrier protein [Sanguibacter antarcticus]